MSGVLASLHGLLYPGLVASDFELIATQTVGAGGAASVTFSSIPGTYKHLQVRGVFKPSAIDWAGIRLNSDSTFSYKTHEIRGDGASATSGSGTPSGVYVGLYNVTPAANTFAALMFDILDYASTSKTTTVRTLHGGDLNGSGTIGLASGMWTSTSAVTSITILGLATSSTLQQFSTFSLYGMK